ncbi:NAD(P)/FAD-dependent oxidoreductase [Hoyosella subflava]|uniref:Ferredoxin reductase n=1 Tax=Hoyosella subflava (strain DSM 45089 / JCM 17490 / NBRC 109087 / DQS3-9A1) TaxID=443218 RepID=F6EPJ5_HOYSD|nr:FAD-dependent oxidoreductase [Hoyosella subflava]AEF39428.1 Ferredoxin reductase [Hoyosella subflava DQS3-9A1]
MKSITVVGASLAGLYAAQALRQQGFDGELTIIGDELRRPYDRPPLSKDFLIGKIDTDVLSLEAADEDLYARWLLGSPAVSLDTASRAVVLADGTRVASDGIVLATGARARKLPGSAAMAGVHVLRTIDDALALRTELLPGARLVVIGAGFIGGEVAATAKKLGLDVTIVEAMATPLAGPLGAMMGTAVCGLHSANGVALRCGVGVRRLTGSDRVESVELVDGTVLPADVVVVGIGAIPNTEWLTGSGVALGNGVECDHQGRTNVPGIIAVGDCAAWHDFRLGRAHRVEHWTGAMERPAIAVAALLRGGGHGENHEEDRHACIPYFWSDQHGVRIQFAGHAAEADSVTIEDGSPENFCFLAVYRRGETPVAVLGMNQSRAFGRWRRQLRAVHSATLQSLPPVLER